MKRKLALRRSRGTGIVLSADLPQLCPRSVYEFDFTGEYQPRPLAAAPANEWSQYLYFRENSEGTQLE